MFFFKQDILNQLNSYIVEEGSIEVCMIKYETKPATADVSLFFISILKIEISSIVWDKMVNIQIEP